MCQKYEGIFIIKNHEDLNKIKEVIDKINNVVLSENANIYHKDELGIKNLAYEVKKQKKGYYYYIKSDVQDNKIDAVGKISTKINTIEEVLKYIIVKLVED